MFGVPNTFWQFLIKSRNNFWPFSGSSISNLLSAVQSFPIFVVSSANNVDSSSSSNTLINNNNHIKAVTSSSSDTNNDQHHVNRGTIPPAIAAQLHQQQSSTTSSSPINVRQTTSKCNEVSAIWAPCMCSLEMCIGWYPCGLKYCKGKQQQQQPDALNAINGSASTSYRCGIKTCRKCYHYVYYVRQKQQCLWDEWPQRVMGVSKVTTGTGKKEPMATPVHSYLLYDLNKLFTQVMHHIL